MVEFEKVENGADFTMRTRREKWPFKEMGVGDAVKFPMADKEQTKKAKRAQVYCGTYGYYSDKKFISETMEDETGKFMYVKRVE